LNPIDGGNVMYPGTSIYHKKEAWAGNLSKDENPSEGVELDTLIPSIISGTYIAYVQGCAVYRTLGTAHHTDIVFICISVLSVMVGSSVSAKAVATPIDNQRLEARTAPPPPSLIAPFGSATLVV
jgi:hypothetical protein